MRWNVAGALGTACALRGLLAFWRGHSAQLEALLGAERDAAAAAKRAAAADAAALNAEIADGKQQLQAAHQLERQLRQKQAALEVTHVLPMTIFSR